MVELSRQQSLCQWTVCQYADVQLSTFSQYIVFNRPKQHTVCQLIGYDSGMLYCRG